MRINNNISAMNTYSRLNSANNAKSSSLAKLSSGLRINRAGDDAAGLAISEKMRGQIGGLKQATRNAQDGISLIQTAEGGLNETHSILNRMRELAVQSSNDTNTGTDRNEIQKEMNELATEITRIGNNTEFNTQKLLNGEFQGKQFHIGANSEQALELNIEDMSAKALEVAQDPKASFNVSVEGTAVIGTVAATAKDYTIEKIDKATIGTTGTLANAEYVIKDGNNVVGASTDGQTWKLVANGSEGTTSTVDFTGSVDIDLVSKVTSGKLTVGTGTTNVQISGKASVDFGTNEVLSAGKYTVDGTDIKDSKGKVVENADKAAIIALVGTATEFEVGSAGIDVSSQKAADAAITTINNAIETVSAERSKLGATQNRLDHTINNLTATAENLSEAESRIRDVDMAEEMMSFTKNNILSQAATSMLAQANQMPQSVLQLLQ